MITSCKMGCKVDCRAIFACRPPCGAFSGTLRPANKTRKASLDAVSGVRQKGKGSTLSQGSACAQPRDQQEAFLSVRALPFPTVNVRCCVLCTQALRSNIDCVELFEVGTRAGLLSALQLVPCRSYGASWLLKNICQLQYWHAVVKPTVLLAESACPQSTL